MAAPQESGSRQYDAMFSVGDDGGDRIRIGRTELDGDETNGKELFVELSNPDLMAAVGRHAVDTGEDLQEWSDNDPQSAFEAVRRQVVAEAGPGVGKTVLDKLIERGDDQSLQVKVSSPLLGPWSQNLSNGDNPKHVATIDIPQQRET